MKDQKTKITRKSREKRLSQAIELKGLYEEAGASNRSYSFICDMINRLQYRNITSGQKRYLDSLIEQGSPEVLAPKNPEKVSEIDAAVALEGMESHREALQSFRWKLAKGYDLSDRQTNFMNILLEKAADIRLNGKFVPSEEDVRILNIAVLAAGGKNSLYWQHRQGQANALHKAGRWLDWKDDKDNNRELSPEPEMSKWLVEKVASTCKTTLRELLNPKHSPGDMRFIRDFKGEKTTCMILAEPQVNSRGKPEYECLVDGEVRHIAGDRIKKR